MNHKQIRTLICTTVIILLVSACGQKGDLYLPTPIPDVPTDPDQEPRKE